MSAACTVHVIVLKGYSHQGELIRGKSEKLLEGGEMLNHITITKSHDYLIKPQYPKP